MNRINYNNWFYESHKYRKNDKTFNDTKWATFKEQQSKLMDSTNQPFGIVGNENGLNRLIDLMSQSNYTFDDIHESLINTYNQSLQNAMSKSVVNSGLIVFSGGINDSHVTSEPSSHYYIIDIPYDLINFGDRDIFIRNKLQLMHHTNYDNYVDYEDFVSSDIMKYLDFTFICCSNGFINNNVKIAFDEYGFKFKVGWRYSQSVTFTIYKIKSSNVLLLKDIDVESVKSGIVNDAIDNKTLDGYKFICDVYDPNYKTSNVIAPNFATFENGNLKIINFQSHTLSQLTNLKSKKVNIILTMVDGLNELPEIYPAANFEDLVTKRFVYDEYHNHVDDEKENRLYVADAEKDYIKNDPIITAPPIILDRPSEVSFSIITDLLSIRKSLTSINDKIKSISTLRNDSIETMSSKMSQPWFSTPQITSRYLIPYVKPSLDVIKDVLVRYSLGAIATSLIPESSITALNDFKNTLERMYELRNNSENDQIGNLKSTYNQMLGLLNDNKFYGDNYLIFVDKLCFVYESEILENFSGITDITQNWFNDYDYKHFKRPVSEQNFIVMKYNRSDACWVFNVPKIHHFCGIGNIFYLSNLTGDEIFKLFVVYTDTESPAETSVSEYLTEKQVFDFSEFENEIISHIGYIKYWYSENKLAKLSRMYFSDYSKEKSTAIISKILRRKIISNDLLYIYPSEMNYESSNMTTNGLDKSGEDLYESPFAINFLFYTMNMMNNQEDKLQAYFYDVLTRRKFSNRYTDIDITRAIDQSQSMNVNFSQFSEIPQINPDASSLENLDAVNIFSGFPALINSYGRIITPVYPYTFNKYTNNRYYLYKDNGFDSERYIGYSESDTFTSHSCYNDIMACKYILKFISNVVYYWNIIETDYESPFMIYSQLETAQTQLRNIMTSIQEDLMDLEYNDSRILPLLNTIISESDNLIYENIHRLCSTMSVAPYVNYNGRNVSYNRIFNILLSEIKYLYVNFGFVEFAAPRIRALYISLKNMNKVHNWWEMKKFIDEDLDLDIIKDIPSYISNNENNDYTGNTFSKIYSILYTQRMSTGPFDLYGQYKDEIPQLRETVLHDWRELCIDLLEKYEGSYYRISEVQYNNVDLFDSKPLYIRYEIDNNDPHFVPIVGDAVPVNAVLNFAVEYDVTEGKYSITNIIPIAEYCIFDSSELVFTGIIYFEDGTSTTKEFTLQFSKVCEYGIALDDESMISSIGNTRVQFENNYEYTVTDTHMITHKNCRMNYELYAGNHFDTLKHEEELILTMKDNLPGPCDVIYIPNSKLNNLAILDNTNNASNQLYVKPVQVLHLEKDQDGVIESIGGMYHEGETIYLQTIDGKYFFPCIITKIDHSEQHGFVECKVDQNNAKWLALETNNDIESYIGDYVQCKIVDDNMRNLLDEYNNSEYVSYYNSDVEGHVDPSDETFEDMYSLRGDPIYVLNNTDYVHTRLSWIFNDEWENRFIDDEHKQYNMQFITTTSSFDGKIVVNALNHDRSPFTPQEEYPILRTEPNDQRVWEQEKIVFYQDIYASQSLIRANENSIGRYEAQKEREKDQTEKDRIQAQIDHLKMQNNELAYRIRRVQYMYDELEKPTSWFNVVSNEAAMIYIDNGKALLVDAYMKHDIRDLVYTDKIECFIYDQQHHVWISPSLYTISTEVENQMNVDVSNNYKTNNVHTKITITLDESVSSDKLYVYFGYYKSDIYSDIVKNDDGICNVVFRPVLATSSHKSDDTSGDMNSIYSNIFIRKHFDVIERYQFTEYDYDNKGIIVDRKKYCNEYDNVPVLRFHHLSGYNSDKVLKYSDFDLYVPNQFKDISVEYTEYKPEYSITIRKPIDSFEDGVDINLICIQNNSTSTFNGNISNMILVCRTYYTQDHEQRLRVVDSNVPYRTIGSFVFTCSRDESYPCEGGLISVIITNGVSESETFTDYVKIEDQYSYYHELPPRFMLIPKDQLTVSTDNPLRLNIESTYYPNNTVARNFTFAQNEAALVWTITHNLNQFPYVVAKDELGNTLIGDLRYTSPNELTITFSSPQKGIAYLAYSDDFTPDNSKFTFDTVDNVWNIEHELHRYPHVTTFDSSENQTFGDVDYRSDSKIDVKFSQGVSGTAYLSEQSSSSDFGPLTPYSYYYDTKHHIRIPFSNISNDNFSSRLQLTKENNPDVQLISTTCLHVCRYSKSRISANGIIDLTGYIPTPLSFDRYEFWINGRYLTKKNIIITSPTTLQLVNLKSLRNFEVIELCDDYYQESPTFNRSIVYETIDGKKCSSMKQVMLHNKEANDYIKQSIRYGFNTNNVSSLDIYLGNYVSNPNNVDTEEDIMNCIVQDSSSYYDISINGTTIKNVLLDDLNAVEISSDMILEMLNDVWKYERLTDFDMDTSFEYVSNNGDEEFIQLHCKHNIEDGTYDVHASGKYNGYFSVYITKNSSSDISDISNTERIITAMRLGVILTLPSEYAGMYLKTTAGDDYILIE